MAADIYELARLRREKKLRRTQEIYAACACEFPLKVYRNLHGHGRTKDDQPCPAIAVIERHDAEDAETEALLGRRR